MKTRYPKQTYQNLLKLAYSRESYRANYTEPEKQKLVECSYIKKLLATGLTPSDLERMIIDEDRYFCFRDFYLYR